MPKFADAPNEGFDSTTYPATTAMWSASAIGVPATQVPFNFTTFALYVQPPFILYFLMAGLTVLPGTRYLRVACWPVVALLALRAALSVDMSFDSFEGKFQSGLATVMAIIAIRSLYWASVKQPLVRQLRPANSPPSTLMDALDLACTFRGYGWDWSRSVYIPRETRPSDRTGFLLYVTWSLAVHGFLYTGLHVAIRSFSPLPGGSIFDDALPSHVQYFRSSMITVISALAAYSLLQVNYDLCTLLAILFFGQDPAQWPPGLDAPWRATSVYDFWERRWHQWAHYIHLIQGGYVLSFLFGRPGRIIGIFLANAVNHHFLLYMLDTTTEFWRMLVGFGMMGVGVLAEQAFTRLTGREVRGLVGGVWAMTWLLPWGNVIVDGLVRAGMFRSRIWVDGIPFLAALVERPVMGFDAWLHGVVG